MHFLYDLDRVLISRMVVWYVRSWWFMFRLSSFLAKIVITVAPQKSHFDPRFSNIAQNMKAKLFGRSNKYI